MIALFNHFAFEFKAGLRDSTLLLMNYLFPLVFYALMGLVMVQVNPPFAEALIPAMVIFATMASTLLGLPGPLVESREAGIYRSYKVNGVPALSIVLIPALTTSFHVLIVSTFIALTGKPLFGGALPVNWIAFVLITLLGVFTCTSLGALIGVVAGDSRSVVLLSQLVFLPSMLLGGLMVPLSLLPSSVHPFSLLLPAAHAMQAYTGFAYGQETVVAPLISALVLGISGLLSFGLAIHLFNWDSRNSSRRGHSLMALLVIVPYLIALVVLI